MSNSPPEIWHAGIACVLTVIVVISQIASVIVSAVAVVALVKAAAAVAAATIWTAGTGREAVVDELAMLSPRKLYPFPSLYQS